MPQMRTRFHLLDRLRSAASALPRGARPWAAHPVSLPRGVGAPLVALLVGWLAAWSGAAIAQPTVVVSLHPYYDLVQRIAGPEADVVRLLPPGASPHDFDPTPSQLERIEGADLVVLNGGLDAWVHDLVDATRSRPPVVEVLDAFEDLEVLLEGQAHDDEHAGDGPAHDQDEDHASDEERDAHGEHGDVNAHVWLDPVLMEEAVRYIGERLAEVHPESAELYRSNVTELVEDLRALDGELRIVLGPVAGASFVPFHDAWPYFAARYQLDLLLEIEPFPGREPSARYLADVVEAIRQAGAPAIFAELQLGDRAARIIAAEAGVDVYVLDPVGGVEGRMTYEELLRYNARTIAEALGGSP